MNGSYSINLPDGKSILQFNADGSSQYIVSGVASYSFAPGSSISYNGTNLDATPLASLGITSIGLAGTGNQGESIDGSAVTNRATFTTSSGTVGEVAAVDLQTDTTGDVTTNASGGMVITSTPEGGTSAASSFVAQNTAAHSYILNNGTLTDRTETVEGSGLSAAVEIHLAELVSRLSLFNHVTGTAWMLSFSRHTREIAW